MMSDTFQYVGNELNVFSLAVNWKRYWAAKIDPYLGNRVLEVGAGIGGNTKQLIHKQRDLWVGLEPDQAMLNGLLFQKEQGEYPAWCEFCWGTIENLPADEMFDSIIYIDVLEHIEDDQHELELAASHLATGGYLTVLSPAYPYLYTEFDAEIGHYRRYTRKSLVSLDPSGLRLVNSFYLDSVGLMASLINKLFLHSSRPSAIQITFWDNYIIPLSKFVDPIHCFSMGRSIVAIWQRA
jgi:ubiquinone/menaquinone biosynthesis C-methylase UbiE